MTRRRKRNKSENLIKGRQALKGTFAKDQRTIRVLGAGKEGYRALRRMRTGGCGSGKPRLLKLGRSTLSLGEPQKGGAMKVKPKGKEEESNRRMLSKENAWVRRKK